MTSKGLIEKRDWFPTWEPTCYPQEFVDWINSINSGFTNRIKYQPLELYKQHCMQLLETGESYDKYYSNFSFDRDEKLTEFLYLEDERCRSNTMYAAMKYGRVNELNVETNESFNFQPYEVQQILAYLFDCMLSAMILKGRQIGGTTAFGIYAGIKANHNKSTFIKYIACDAAKTEEIFEHKIQYPASQYPDYLQQNVDRESKRRMVWRTRQGKGSWGGQNSSILVDNPKVDAINGGSPLYCLIDEMGLIDTIFGQMMREGMPTLYYAAPGSSRLMLKRVFLGWSTGGKMDRGGAVLEDEFKSLHNSWQEGKYGAGIIPIFFDFWARHGMTQKFYDAQKEFYYSKTGVERELSRVQFHQHYPVTINDVFVRSERTLVTHDQIIALQGSIWNMKPEVKPKYGYYEPIYDESKPYNAGKIPYKVVGAKFVETELVSSPLTKVCMWMEPERGWKDRYYHGIDPIDSETGHSYFSASVWDCLHNTVSSCVFYRETDYDMCFMQGILQAMYYDTEKNYSIPELIESNIGSAYLKMREHLGLERTVVANAQLPAALRSGQGSKWWGINNKTNTASRIINEMSEMLDLYKGNIKIMWILVQLKTFVEKDLPTSNTTRDTRWQAANRKFDRDDALFATTFSYICSKCFEHLTPKELDKDMASLKYRKRKIVQNAETGFMQVRKDYIDTKPKFVSHGR